MADVRGDPIKRLELKVKTLTRENRQLKITVQQIRRIVGRR